MKVLFLLVLAILPFLVNSTKLVTRCTSHRSRACRQHFIYGSLDIKCRSHNKACDQKCIRAGCSMNCVTSKPCRQRCISSGCKNMVCNSHKCTQSCLESRCQMECNGERCKQSCEGGFCNMTCPGNAKKCIQTCQGGGCFMACPKGVDYCEQHCSRGKCFMMCAGRSCRRTCGSNGECRVLNSPLATSLTRFTSRKKIKKCDSVSNNMCFQKCLPGKCDISYDNDPPRLGNTQVCLGGNCVLGCNNNNGKCRQNCPGGRCIPMTCNSRKCIQGCGGGACVMRCTALKCNQVCLGGACTMECSSRVKKCYQSCQGGGCLFKCNARRCFKLCPSGNCRSISPPTVQPKIPRECKYMKSGRCKQECTRKRCALSCKGTKPYGSCDQTCAQGRCRLKCHTPNSCKQSCKRGKCFTMTCKSKKCTQDCTGNQCRMACTSDNCQQRCTGRSCNMDCGRGTKNCHQICDGGGCVFNCYGKKCTHSCKGGGCVTRVAEAPPDTTNKISDKTYFLSLFSKKGQGQGRVRG